MITAIVRFQLPKGMTLEDAKSIYQKSTPNCQRAPGLIRKYYLFGQDQVGGGVYLRQNRKAAEKMYSPAWKKMIAERYGAPAEIHYYETPVIVDNTQQ
jgi:hypothetical protein